MKLSTRIITAVLLVAGSSGVVYAFSKHDDWGMTPEEKVDFVTERATKKLDLDAQQSAYFGELAKNIAQVMQEVRASRAENMAEFESLLQQPSLDQARALEIIRQKTRLIDERAPQVIASLATFVDSLNPEQKQQLQEFIEHARERGHGHHGHGHGH